MTGLQIKLGLIIIAGLVGLFLVNSYAKAKQFRIDAIAAVEVASGKQGLNSKTAIAEIHVLGALRDELAKAEAEGERLRDEAEQSRQASEGKRAELQATSDRLVAVSRTSKNYKQACEPSDAVKELWK